MKRGSNAGTIALQDKDFDKNIQSREINDDNEEKLPRKQSAKVLLKKWKKERSNYSNVEGVVIVLATPKAPQGKTPSSFAIYVDDKLKQMDARSRTITEKRVMDIFFEVDAGTTCVAPTQRQHSISMRPAEAQYSNATTPVRSIRVV